MKKQTEKIVASDSEFGTKSSTDIIQTQKATPLSLPPLAPTFNSSRNMKLTSTNKSSYSQKRSSLKAHNIELIDHVIDLCRCAKDPSERQKMSGSISKGKKLSKSTHLWASNLSEGLKVSKSREELERFMRCKSRSQQLTRGTRKNYKEQLKKT